MRRIALSDITGFSSGVPPFMSACSGVHWHVWFASEGVCQCGSRGRFDSREYLILSGDRDETRHQLAQEGFKVIEAPARDAAIDPRLGQLIGATGPAIPYSRTLLSTGEWESGT